MKKGAITLLDILEYKETHKRKDILQTLIQLAKRRAISIDKYIAASDIRDIKQFKIEIKSIANTIALITYSDDSDLVLMFHVLILNKLIAQLLSLKILVRGAIAYGYLSGTDNIIVGPAVNEVISWYKIAEWVGVILTPSVSLILDEDEPIVISKHVVNYKIPRKQIDVFKTYCVNWIVSWKHINGDKSRESLLEVFQQTGPITPDIAVKYRNTLDFMITLQ